MCMVSTQELRKYINQDMCKFYLLAAQLAHTVESLLRQDSLALRLSVENRPIESNITVIIP